MAGIDSGVGQAAGVNNRDDRYKWVALTNTTVGVLLATIDSSIMLIAMPDIFRGIKLDPLEPGNSAYLLWLILGYLVTSSVLVVSVGRLGDMFGRVKMYNLGFVIYTFASLLLTIDWMTGHGGAIWLLVWRIVQGVGGAFLVGNSGAILTDAFPARQRGLALGINNVAGISGSFIGLVLGGLLAPISWRLVFLISVPAGLFGAIWAFRKLRDLGTRSSEPIDWLGNVTFAAGMILVMVGITHGIQPYGGSVMGWTSPSVLTFIIVGVALLIAFGVIETRVAHPMFRLPLFRIRAFTFGTISTFLSALGRGGLMFMMIIWLQGIWLPLHGYSFEQTPLQAGIHMLPLTAGFLLAGPDFRVSVRPVRCETVRHQRHARGRVDVRAAGVVADRLLLSRVRGDPAAQRAGDGLLRVTEPGGGDEQPADAAPWRGRRDERDVPELGAGLLHRHLLHADDHRPGGGAAADAHRGPDGAPHTGGRGGSRGCDTAGVGAVRGVPRVQPDPASGRQRRARPVPAADRATLTGSGFFPKLISGPFESGLHVAFGFAIAACLIAAAASAFRGTRYVATDMENQFLAGQVKR